MYSRLFKILVVTFSIQDSKAFCAKQNIANIMKKHNNAKDSSQTCISMFVSIDSLDIFSPITKSFKDFLESNLQNSLGSAEDVMPSFQTILESPEIESNILADISHIGLDFGAYLSDKTEALRLIILLGRVLSIISDYIPDHKIQPDELVIQLYMLYFSSRLFIRSYIPIISALRTSLSFEELRLYSTVFKPAGVSILQYRALASIAFEWREVSSYSTLLLENEDEVFYMLYRGKIDITTQIEQLPLHEKRSDRSTCDDQSTDAFGFFGHLAFARRIVAIDSFDENKTANNANQHIQRSDDFSKTNRVRAGADGALLLKVNTVELLNLMAADDRFSNSIKSIIFTKMHEKLSKRLEVIG
eukprot:CAMPEP_0197833980 /NCGR_PEP_ID=MMETSP1437-20131217/20786_1 /TAXON_ID=49252 ORGANISM="Eucampia antarctica, Strain CCMP1452" /NCGR_SAMPLE_ID=MMETSP1437 /ASSEMBLY_ACC=CAM_ASM_001096 /LENGTH=358 /DNA_ID=CAMNT_0043438337 /DNA_START=123 /DNA_END=1199 /DNA_ORIENTATION=-